jgi:hypothetical protein
MDLIHFALLDWLARDDQVRAHLLAIAAKDVDDGLSVCPFSSV